MSATIRFVVLCAWILVLGALGMLGAYGNGFIWSDGWSLSDGDDIMFVVYAIGVFVLTVSAMRA